MVVLVTCKIDKDWIKTEVATSGPVQSNLYKKRHIWESPNWLLYRWLTYQGSVRKVIVKSGFKPVWPLYIYRTEKSLPNSGISIYKLIVYKTKFYKNFIYIKKTKTDVCQCLPMFVYPYQ